VAFAVSAVVTSTKVRCPSRFNSSPAAPLASQQRRGETVRNSFEYSTALYALPRDLSRKVVSYSGKVLDALLRSGALANAKAKILDGRRSTITSQRFDRRERKRERSVLEVFLVHD